MGKKTNIVQFTTTPGKTVLERFKNYSQVTHRLAL